MKQDFKKVLLSPKLKYYDNIVLAYTDDVFVPMKLDYRIRPISLTYCQVLGDSLKSRLDEHSLILYCRSFVSDMNNYDVCIRYKDDLSRLSDLVIGLVEEGFIRHGYKVQIEESLSNLMAIEKEFRYSLLTIDVNERLCMDERSVVMKETLEEIYSVLFTHSELI